MRFGFFLVVLLICGCAQPRLDGSSDKAFVESAKAVRGSLKDDERKRRFDESVMLITLHEATPSGGLLDLSGTTPEAFAAKMRSMLDGKSGEEVIAIAEALRKEEQAKQRAQAISEISELRAKQVAADVAKAKLRSFSVSRSRFYISQSGFMKQPVLEISVKNGTDAPVSRAYMIGTLSSPGRSIPWLRDSFNYEIPGGIEPGESATWSLSPNMFSEWGTTPHPADSVLTVEVVRVDGVDGKPLFDAAGFSDDDAARLAELSKKFL